MTTIGITGSSGMLGKDLQELLIREKNYNLKLYDFPDSDITNENCQNIIVSECDVVVNCAAYTAVDAAEKNKECCFAVNAYAVEKLGKLCRRFNKYLIHISTDFVFGDDSDAPMNEEFPANPLSIYGESKFKGETLLSSVNSEAAIMRVQWTYGKYGNHFISKVLELAKKFDSIKIVNDQFGSPTCTEYAAKAILCLIKKRPSGLFHFAADNYASRYDTAEFIIKSLNLKTTLNPCSTEEFPAPAKRPKNSRFDCTKIDRILDFKRPDWKDSLNRFLIENYK